MEDQQPEPYARDILEWQILYEGDRVVGIATNDMGIAKDGSRKPNFQRGIELKGMYFEYIMGF